MKPGEAQRWLAAIVESSDDAVIGKRLDGTIVTWNRGAQRIFGYTADEIIGQSVLTLFPPELQDEEPQLIARLVRGERVEHYETTRLTKDGRRIDVSLSVSPILDAGGAMIGAAKIARDITDVKRMRRALETMNEQLEEQAVELEHQVQESATIAAELVDSNSRLEAAVAEARRAQRDAESANRVKGDFLATMSHELRTPLNAISGYADLMATGVHGELPSQYKDYLDRIQRSQKHLLELISGLLDFSKLEAGKLQLSIEPVSVGRLLEQLETLVVPQARAKKHQLRIMVPDTDIRVLADPDRTPQILLNLLANAIKFTPQGGSITVNVERGSGNRVSIRVSDTGPGIAKANIDKIFEPFVQLEKTLTRGHEGTGLGLAISRELARAMHGDVIVESTTAHGSTFVLQLRGA